MTDWLTTLCHANSINSNLLHSEGDSEDSSEISLGYKDAIQDSLLAF